MLIGTQYYFNTTKLYNTTKLHKPTLTPLMTSKHLPLNQSTAIDLFPSVNTASPVSTWFPIAMHIIL